MYGAEGDREEDNQGARLLNDPLQTPQAKGQGGGTRPLRRAPNTTAVYAETIINADCRIRAAI
jgi:hypothetical protein